MGKTGKKNKRVRIQVVVYPYDGILFNNKREELLISTAIWMNIRNSERYVYANTHMHTHTTS